MAILRRRQRQDQPMQKMFYRDYVKSTFWELRKRRYFAGHGKACAICDDTEGLEIVHLRHGDYGHERDTDLVALCREHQAKIQEIDTAQSNSDTERARYIARARALHLAEQGEKDETVLPYDYSPSLLISIHILLDTMARPIRRMFSGVMRW